MSTESVVRHTTELFNKHDVDAAVAQATDDVEFKNVPWDVTFTGKDGYRQALGGWIAAFPDVEVEVVSLVVGENSAAYEYVFKGTNTGPLASPKGLAAPTGRRVAVNGCSFIKVRDGKVSSVHVYFDPTVGSVVSLDLLYA
jgi:steroid delta-isomerase-like uncharacterized protein